MDRPLTAPDIYALSQSRRNDGPDECHWCGSPCQRTHVHDGMTYRPLAKDLERPKRPSNAYVCTGCRLWRRGRVTVHFLNGSYRDGQRTHLHSWWITPEISLAINGLDKDLLRQRLVSPPRTFVLSLVTSGNVNMLHHAVANDVCELKADTPLRFTADGLEMSWTVYELQEAIRHGPEGKSPGVQFLHRLIGSPEPEPYVEQTPVTPQGGRPPALEDGRKTKKILAKSGYAVVK